MDYTIGLLTTDDAFLQAHDKDSSVLAAGLAEAGFRVSAPVWHDPAVDWAAFDLLVVRSPWDYPERYAEFTGWLARAALSDDAPAVGAAILPFSHRLLPTRTALMKVAAL